MLSAQFHPLANLSVPTELGPRHRDRLRSDPERIEGWIASSLPLLAMTLSACKTQLRYLAA